MEKISRFKVACYYVESELSRLVDCGDLAVISDSLDMLSNSELMRLCEGLSIQYRVNGVFWLLQNEEIDWQSEAIAVERITIPGLGKNKITDLLKSDLIKHNSIKFRDYLLHYFAKHPSSDPEQLDEVRPDPTKKLTRPKVIALSHNDQVAIIDGTHRFIEQLLGGSQNVPAFVGYASASFDYNVSAGAGTLQALKKMYINSSNNDNKAAILKVMELLCWHSPSAKEDIIYTWINRQGDQTVINAAKCIIDKIDISKN